MSKEKEEFIKLNARYDEIEKEQRELKEKMNKIKPILLEQQTDLRVGDTIRFKPRYSSKRVKGVVTQFMFIGNRGNVINVDVQAGNGRYNYDIGEEYELLEKLAKEQEKER